MSSINGYLFSGGSKKVPSPKNTPKKAPKKTKDPFDWSPGSTPVPTQNPFERKFVLRGTPVSYTPTNHTFSHTEASDLELVAKELKKLQINKDGNPPKYG